MTAFVAIAVLAALVAAGSVVAFAYGRDLEAARLRVASGSRIAQTRCGPIEYALRGEGDTILLVHGAGGGFDQAMDFAPALAAQGLRVVAMSRFGYLQTPLPADASPEAQADAHAGLLDTLGIDRATIVGVSAGAPSAMQFALRHPDRTAALVLMVPAAYAPRPEGAPSITPARGTGIVFDTALRSDFLLWAALRVAPGLLTRSLLATEPRVLASASMDEQARAARILEHILPVAMRRRGLVNDAAVTSTIPRYDLERIAAPTLVIGVKDCLYGTYEAARFAAERIPGARFLSFERGGHVWIGHQQEIARQVLAFAKGHAQPVAKAASA